MQHLFFCITERVWSNCIWAGCYREDQAFVASHYCALDIDDGATKLEALEILKDYNYILGATKSDGLEKVENGKVKPPMDRFRVVIPWSEPIYSLDVYKYNIKLMAKKLQADKKALDGARCWQPCKQIDYFNHQGKNLQVIVDIPEEEREDAKTKKFADIQEYYKNTTRVPQYVEEVLSGQLEAGDINDKLLLTAYYLFQVKEKSFDYVMDFLGGIEAIKNHSHFETTVISAAKKSGVF